MPLNPGVDFIEFDGKESTTLKAPPKRLPRHRSEFTFLNYQWRNLGFEQVQTLTRYRWLKSPWPVGVQRIDFLPTPFNSANVAATEDNDTLSATTHVPPPLLSTISTLDPSLMTILATSATQTLYYDEPSTECFYILAVPPDPAVTRPTLFLISPLEAQAWYGNALPKQIIYNPFIYNPTFPLSPLR